MVCCARVILVSLLFSSAALVCCVHGERAHNDQVLSLDEKQVPDLRPSETADPRSSNNLLASAARSVNLSFFIPAFSLFALASQLMPQMFPSLTTTTTSSRRFPSNQNVPGGLLRGRSRTLRASKKKKVEAQ